MTGVLTYTIAAGSIALVTNLVSYRNVCFLRRYAELIEQSHILAKTTPVYRMQRFYLVNVLIVSIAYLIKIINLGVTDYNMRRPDLTWAGLELTDAILLVWHAIAVLPRKKSALYVDMSNVSNARLQEAEAWRTTQAERANPSSLPPRNGPPPTLGVTNESGSQSNRPASEEHSVAESGELSEMEDGRRQAIMTPSAEPHPPWIAWTSGMVLPRPNAHTWGGYEPVARIIQRERKLVPVLPPPIIVGTPTADGETLRLTIGMPTVGPSSVPRVFDDTGIEIPEEPRGPPAESDALRMREATTDQSHTLQDRRDAEGERSHRLRGAVRRLRNRAQSRDGISNHASVETSGSRSDRNFVSRNVSRTESIRSQVAPSVASSTASGDGLIFTPGEDVE